MAAEKPAGRPSSGPTTQPRVAPMKKVGTTSPPLKPQARVTAVKRIFSRKAKGLACPCSTARVMISMPAPLYSMLPTAKVMAMIRAPPARTRR